jgi:hypothetical protein
MAFGFQGIAGSHQKDEGKDMPIELLSEDKGGIEKIAHYHIEKGNPHQQQGGPGHDFAHPFVDGVDSQAEFLENLHGFGLLSGFSGAPVSGAAGRMDTTKTNTRQGSGDVTPRPSVAGGLRIGSESPGVSFFVCYRLHGRKSFSRKTTRHYEDQPQLSCNFQTA